MDHTVAADIHPLPEVMKPEQTADFVGSTVQALAQDRYLGRGLPYTRYGGRIRYLRQDVLDYLAANRVEPSTSAPESPSNAPRRKTPAQPTHRDRNQI